MNAAQKVRLWAMGICQGLAIIFTFLVLGQPASTTVQNFDGSTTTLITGQVVTNQSLFGFAVLALLLQIAVGIMAVFTIYRMFRPVEVRKVSDWPRPSWDAQGHPVTPPVNPTTEQRYPTPPSQERPYNQ